VTLPRLTRLEYVPVPQAVTLTTGGLGMVQVCQGVRRVWRVTMERDSMQTDAGRARWRALQAVVSHLETGGAIGLSTDHAKSWAGYPAGAIIQGGSYVTWWGNAFSAWNSSAAPVAGDDIVVEQAPMYGLRECHKVAALSGSQISYSGTTGVFDHAGVPLLVRYAGFFPALRMPFDKYTPPETNEHGIIHTLELNLEMDAAVYAANVQQQSLGLGSTSASQYQSGGSLEAFLSRRAGASGLQGMQPRIGSAYLLQSSGRFSR
jgi:hypothetical protein